MAKEKVKKEPAQKPEKASKKKKSDAEENPILKLEKPVRIELQNCLFGTSEKKLMVSEDFLNSMCKKYISKRMEIINKAYENIHITRSPEFFFRNTAEIEKYIEDLIMLEKYYPFKNPVPTIYKRNYMAHKPAAITGMIARAWKGALKKFPLDDKVPIDEISPVAISYYDEVISSLLTQKQYYSEEDMKMIDSYYVMVHGEQEPEPEIDFDGFDENSESEESENNSENNNDEEASAEVGEFTLNLDGES